MDKMDLYNHLPVFAQNMACYLEGKRILRERYNPAFDYLLEKYESRNGWSYERLCEYRDKRLRKMVRHCYETVDYYKTIFSDSGIHYTSIKYLDDLKKLPVLDKQMVLNNYEQFISKAVPRKQMVTSHTSGTTGSGFVFYTTQKALCEQWAVWWRYRKRLGISMDTWCALFGGRSVVPVTKLTPPFSRMNLPCKQEYFSIYHLNESNMEWYLDELEKKKLKWIHGYPSAINLMADYLLETGRRLNYPIQFITTGAENLLPSQKDKIKDAFGTIPYNHYGLSEAVANFSENLKGEMIVDEDFAAVEFCKASDCDETEIIGTTLTNFAMPLLRYRTNDIAKCRDTRHGRVVESLDGRQEDYVIMPDGRKIGRLDHIFKDMVNIKESQICQKEHGAVIINVVRGAHYTEADERRLIKEAELRLSGLKINIAYTDKIKRTSSGKLRFVICDIR